MKKSNREAAIPNPALKSFSAFVGEWKTVGTHGYIPDTILHGHTSFKWIEGGAFLTMHSEICLKIDGCMGDVVNNTAATKGMKVVWSGLV